MIRPRPVWVDHPRYPATTTSINDTPTMIRRTYTADVRSRRPNNATAANARRHDADRVRSRQATAARAARAAPTRAPALVRLATSAAYKGLAKTSHAATDCGFPSVAK